MKARQMIRKTEKGPLLGLHIRRKRCHGDRQLGRSTAEEQHRSHLPIYLTHLAKGASRDYDFDDHLGLSFLRRQLL
jgi:hypothetical protein